MMRSALLHSTGRYCPHALLEVDFTPFHLPYFTWPLKHMRGELQGEQGWQAGPYKRQSHEGGPPGQRGLL